MGENSNKRWTEDDDRTLIELKAAGRSTFSIAAVLKRSAVAIEERLHVLKARNRREARVDIGG